VLSTVDMVVQRRDGPRRLRENDDDDDAYYAEQDLSNGRVSVRLSVPSNDSSSGRRLLCCKAPAEAVDID